jgi:hypothetical protein
MVDIPNQATLAPSRPEPKYSTGSVYITRITKSLCVLRVSAVRVGSFSAVALVALCLAAGSAAAGGVRFLAMGDTPYNGSELRVLKAFLAQEVRERPPFIIHVGDIKGGSEPCTDERLKEIADLFAAQPVPIAYTPGDNEWTDCHRWLAGGYDPLERLAAVRRLFFADPSVLKLDSLEAVHPQKGFPEDYYFLYRGVMLAAVHVVGSHNNRKTDDPAAMAELSTRSAANRRLLEQAAEAARAAKAFALVVFFQADPGFGGSQPPHGFAPLWADLRMLVEDFPGPVLVIHGDTHRYRFDQPMENPRTGETAARFYRLEVPGSPVVGGVWVRVHAQGGEPFEAAPVYPDARDLFLGE